MLIMDNIRQKFLFFEEILKLDCTQHPVFKLGSPKEPCSEFDRLLLNANKRVKG